MLLFGSVSWPMLCCNAELSSILNRSNKVKPLRKFRGPMLPIIFCKFLVS